MESVRSAKTLVLYFVMFALSFIVILTVYRFWYMLNYKKILDIIFLFKIDLLELIILVPFILLSAIPFIIALSFSGVFEDQDGVYASIGTTILIVILSILIVGFTIPIFITALVMGLAFPLAISRIKKKLGLFKLRNILWKESYILFLVISAALAIGLMSSFLMDFNHNKMITEEYFTSAPTLGVGSGYDALRAQLRASYITGFTEGALYSEGGTISPQRRSEIQTAAESASLDILGQEEGSEAIKAYASSFPFFDVIVILVPILLSITIFFVSLAIFTFILRPLSMLVVFPLYDFLMRFYIRVTF